MPIHPYQYCPSLVEYKRRKTIEVTIGDVKMGGDNPIRVQSMTTIDTMDTEGSIAQTIRMVEAGCEYVRITAPSLKEAQNLAEIKKGLRAKGYDVPLIADIHFTPNAAELAAKIVEKVRVNPGNYADKKKFNFIEYDDESYQAEIDRIREKFSPLVEICKEYGTAMRIGTNHGSLSDRILSRYGDTPIGMVESALEFLRICEDLEYYNIVLSMKASNTQVMIQAYRLLVQKLDEEGLKPYPLHLGVTEAGDGEDGRIKSAVGIGALLEDGLGDTVRVSLTEEPEAEAPVARKLIDRYTKRKKLVQMRTFESASSQRKYIEIPPKNPFGYERRTTQEVANLGATNVPRIIADFSEIHPIQPKDLKVVGHSYLPELDKWGMNDQGCDYIYTGKNKLDFMLPNGLKEVLDAEIWSTQSDKVNAIPYFSIQEFKNSEEFHQKLNFVGVCLSNCDEWLFNLLETRSDIALVLTANFENALQELRQFFFQLYQRKLETPVIIRRAFPKYDAETLQLHASADIGGLLIDGFGDGAMLGMELVKQGLDKAALLQTAKEYNGLAFGILQAARTRMTKTEYISCPSCGRTLFDLQETTALIRQRTDHLKGVKIGIMGCIVNGPGEMADADYGYVGSGKGKITLYRGQEVVKRAVPSANAVDELIGIIQEDGNWLEREVN
ncbi:MAG: (E)-4-hydroxy-3-methylbut-2-enyl-diphosphate synthase [Flammeovirgaceae bacterium]|jgi:(E)-4-hydroxy-3-methylbut-2-enyl-diphosphate synthase